MASMCLLTPQQTSLIRNQRNVTVHEQEGTKEAPSSDIESTDTETVRMQLEMALKKMSQSNDRTDIRLFNLIKIGN